MPSTSLRHIPRALREFGSLLPSGRAAALGSPAPTRRVPRVTIQDLGSLGELIAAIATVATLAYLAVQIRQNTQSVRASSRLDVASGWRAHNQLMLDPKVNRAYQQGLRAYPDLPYEPRNVFVNLFGDHAVFFQGAFALYEEGQVDRQTYEDYLTWFACQVVTPGGRALWKEVSPFLVKGAVAAVDERLERDDLPDILSLKMYSLDD